LNPTNQTILLTIDVEDWFQVENFKKCIPFSSWPDCELRVEKNVHKLLDLLDSIELNNPINPRLPQTSSKASLHPPIIFLTAAQQHGNTKEPSPQSSDLSLSAMPSASSGLSSSPPASRLTPNGSIEATFFVLGWIAERLPHLIREIQARGHEVASHGYDHVLCREQSAEDLKHDLSKSKKLLEDITGRSVYGYRAPGFSISRDILSLVEEAGYLYDSSFNSFKLNKRYGQIELKPNHGNGILHKISESFYEVPISNVRIGGKVVPWGGGGYFRLFPLKLFKQGVQSILKKQGAYLFYMHPWEIDPDQPSVKGVPFTFRMRHYVNMGSTFLKLSAFLEGFKNYQYRTCHQYLLNHHRAKEANLLRQIQKGRGEAAS